MELFTLMALFFVIGGLVITAIVMGIEISKHRPVRAATSADRYLVKEEAKMTANTDTFLRTHTTKTKVSSSDGKK